MPRRFTTFVRNIEAIGLRSGIESRALKSHVSLRDLYEGPNRAPSIAAARRTVYVWLLSQGKGINEIARLFDRAPNGVFKLTQKKGG